MRFFLATTVVAAKTHTCVTDDHSWSKRRWMVDDRIQLLEIELGPVLWLLDMPFGCGL
jgi:hypothetical protein